MEPLVFLTKRAALVGVVMGLLLGVTPVLAECSPDAGEDRDRVVRFDPASFQQLKFGAALPAAIAGASKDRDPLVLTHRSLLQGGVFMQFIHPSSPALHASLFLRDGRLTGALYNDSSLRTVLRSRERGVSIARVEDANLDLPCGCDALDLVAPPLPASAEGSIAGAPCDDGTVVDILVVYTDAAVAQAGLESALQDEIAWAIGDANATYAGSNIALTARMVGCSRLVGFAEDSSDLSVDLVRLSNTADGVIDEVHALRDAAGADLVAMVRADSPLSCGVAWILQEVDVAQAPSGFSVTALGCFANRTFTHELAHNMGCCHAIGDGGGCAHQGGIFPDAMGHRFVGSDGVDYRTIMAYPPGARVPRFSSPQQTWAGTPTGIVDVCDNVRALDLTRSAFTNFRCTTIALGCEFPAAIGCCTTDLDGDGATGASDLAELLGAWGSPNADANGDGITNGEDLAAVLAAWGPCG